MRQSTWTGGRSRRRLLRQTGTALATAAAGASAGCTNLLPPASRAIRYGDVDVPRRGETRPVYRKWLPAESEFPDRDDSDDDGLGNWVYVTPGDLGADQFEQPFDLGRSVVQASIDYLGQPLDAYDRLVAVGPLGSVVEGPVDRDAVHRTMASTNYERAGEYRKYAIYERTDLDRIVAVADDVLLHASGEHRRTNVQVLADAGAGRIDRRHEVDETFAAYTDHVGAAPTILDAFGLLDGELDSGLWFTFDESSVYFVHHHVFPEGEAPSTSEVKREISGIARGRRAARVDVTADDPFVRVALQLEQSTYESDEAYRSLPFVTWGVDDGRDAITVTHDAGEPVPVDHLEIEPSDALRNPPAEGSTVERGDELAFATDDEIQFTYRQSEDSTTRLFHYEPANASPT